MIHSVRWRIACIFVVLFAAASRAAEDPSWDDVTGPNRAPTEAQVRAHLDSLDDDLVKLRAKVSQATALDVGAPDFRGRTFRDDWQQYVLTSATLAELEAKRHAVTDALERHDVPAATVALWEYRFRDRDEAELCAAIVQYWQVIGNHPPDWRPYLEMLRENGIEQHFARNFESLQRTWTTELNKGLFPKAVNVTWPKIQALHVRGGRNDAVALEARSRTAAVKRLDSVTVSGDCIPPAGRTSGTSEIKPDGSSPPRALEYPNDSRRRFEEGTVRVGVIVSAEGCVRTASVFASSGYEQLDRAAVEHVAAMRFLPAERGGVAVEATSIAPINFRMSELHPAPTGVPAP